MPLIRQAKQVLLFNRYQKLVMIANSLNALRHLEIPASVVSRACTGEIVSYKGHYYRYADPNITIEPSDLGVLTLKEYDKACGNDEFRYYKTNKVKRNRRKATKKYQLVNIDGSKSI